MASEREHYTVHTVAAVFPYLCFEEKTLNLSNTERRPTVLLRRSDECNLEQFEASQHRGRSGQKVQSTVQTDDALIVELPDGISRRSDECKGSDYSDLEYVQNLLET
jgi:hypothetical protein